MRWLRQFRGLMLKIRRSNWSDGKRAFLLRYLCVLPILLPSVAVGASLFEEVRELCGDEGPAFIVLLKTPEVSTHLACGQEREGGPATTIDSRFLIASVSKAYLAVAMMQLDETGVLDIDDPVSSWLPQDVIDAFGNYEGITIAHLLTMSSGLPDYLDDEFYEVSLERITRGATSGEVLRMALKSVADERRHFSPGASFDYSNTNYVLAQLVLEKAASAPLQEVLAGQIFKPLGLTQTKLLGFGIRPEEFVRGYEDFGNGLEPVDRYLTGFGFGDGGLVSTAEDVATFYRALLMDRSLLEQESLDRLLHDPTGQLYGMGLEVERHSDLGQVIGHSGGDVGFSADVRHSVEEGVTAVFLSAQADDDLSVTWDMLTDGF